MNLELICQDFERTVSFKNKISYLFTNQEINIICPYLTLDILKEITTSSKSWKLITDITALFLSTKKENHNALLEFINSNSDKIRNINNTHAKAIISKDKAFFGSANFTNNGLNKNIELSGIIEDNLKISELNNWFNDLWNKSNFLDMEQVSCFVSSISVTMAEINEKYGRVNFDKSNINKTITEELEIQSIDELPQKISNLVSNFKNTNLNIKSSFKIRFFSDQFKDEEINIIINEASKNIENFDYDKKIDDYGFFDFSYVEKGVYEIGDWILLCEIDSNCFVSNNIEWFLITNILNTRFLDDNSRKRFIALDLSLNKYSPPFALKNIKIIRDLINSEDFNQIREPSNNYSTLKDIFDQRALKKEIENISIQKDLK